MMDIVFKGFQEFVVEKGGVETTPRRRLQKLAPSARRPHRSGDTTLRILGTQFGAYDMLVLQVPIIEDFSASEARSRLDQCRFLRPNTHFFAFFEIYKKIIGLL